MKLLFGCYLLLCCSLSLAQGPSTFTKKGKTGLLSKEGKKLVEAQYDSINPFILNKTKLFKAWKNGMFVLFNEQGKGNEKDPITDLFPITMFPNTDYILTMSGGDWYRMSFGKSLPISDSVKSNPNAGFKMWVDGKRGIYDSKNALWILPPVYSNIYVPLLSDYFRDSILPEQATINALTTFYGSMNDMGSWDINAYRAGGAPFIVKKDNKFWLCSLNGKVLNESVSYDSIFYNNQINLFCGIRSNSIVNIDLSGNIVNGKFRYEEYIPGSAFLIVSDSGIPKSLKTSYGNNEYAIIKSSKINDTTKMHQILYEYSNKLEVSTKNIGIYNLVSNKLVVPAEYEKFEFYSPYKKNNYYFTDTATFLPGKAPDDIELETKKETVTENSSNIYYSDYNSSVRFPGVLDGVFVREDIITSLNFAADHINNAPDFDYPFWALKNGVYTLFHISGSILSKTEPVKYEYKYIAQKTECYLLHNKNNTQSLITVNGWNALPLMEYDKIIETRNGVKVYKNGKEEIINF